MSWTRSAYFVLVCLLMGAGFATQHLAHPLYEVEPRPEVQPGEVPKGYVLVSHAIDGDTLELADGRRVRYLGMDTPETVHPKKPVQCYGPEASAYNHSLVDSRVVRLVRDVEDTDKYGRLLRYIYLEDGTFVNLALVSQGYARVYTWPPNIAHTKEFIAAQTRAQADHQGLWSKCVAK